MDTRPMRVGLNRWIGSGQPALVVAEIGQNHNGDAKLAEQLVDAAAWAGADAVKVVKRDLASELSTEARAWRYDSPHAFGDTYGEHRQRLELDASVHECLRQRARRHGLLFFATACDVASARLMQQLEVDVFKVASRDLLNLPLLEFLRQTNRPVFLSTGMSSVSEIDVAVEVLQTARCELLLMHCTSLYPTPQEEVHLRSMALLAERYRTLVGYSDHTLGHWVAPVAVALGAVAVEKHLTLDKQLKGSDHACSVEPDELRQMIADIRRVETALGRGDKPVPSGVAPMRAKLGRSLVARVPITAGTRIDESMLALKCPGDGLSWLDRQLVVGRRAGRNIAADEKLSIHDFAET